MGLRRLLLRRRAPPWTWTAALLLLGLMGCAHHDFAWTSTAPDAPPFTDSGQDNVPVRWWTVFENSALDGEIERSLGGNFDLVAAWQRLRAARALARREASDLLPDLDGFAFAEAIGDTAGDDYTNFALGLDAAYEIDLWGRIESRVDAERLRASATREEYLAAELTLSAGVAGTWFALIESHSQIALLDEQIETNQKGLELQEARFSLGQIRSADVLRQRQLVEATREQSVVVRARIALLEHQLAVLQGRPPQESTYATGDDLPDLPPLPDTGIPAELVNRRPDVRRDFLAILASDRDLASAISDQYPRIGLTGSVTTAAENPEHLFRDWIASIAGQIVAPLIDGGQRRAEVDRASAVARERIAQYEQTVLIAFREVEDALARERHLRERIESLDIQLKLARQSSIQLREQYIFFGETDYLDVLSAITEEQRLQRATLSARLELILNRIELYLALAGDIDSGVRDLGDDCFP